MEIMYPTIFSKCSKKLKLAWFVVASDFWVFSGKKINEMKWNGGPVHIVGV